MKKNFLLACLTGVSLFALSASVGLVLTPVVEKNIDVTGVTGNAMTMAVDPGNGDVYFTSGNSDAAASRAIGVISDALGTPAVSVFADVPVYTGAAGSYTENSWLQYTYLTGLAVSDSNVYVGGNTFFTNGDDASGFYMVQMSKSGILQNVYKNGLRLYHLNNGLAFYRAPSLQTFYTDAAGNWCDSDAAGAVAHVGEYALLASQPGRGVFAFDPNNFEYGSGTQYQRNFRPLGWDQTARSTCRDLAFDSDGGDLYVGCSNLSDAVIYDDIHASWQPKYPEGFPACDGPGLLRQKGYNPFVYDNPQQAGTATEALITLPAIAENQQNAAWFGIELYKRDTNQYVFMFDNWNDKMYCYHLETSGDDVIPTKVAEVDGQFNDGVVVNDGTDDYLLTSSWGIVKAYLIEDEPTSATSWTMFE